MRRGSFFTVLQFAEKPVRRDIIPHRAAPDQMINKWDLISAWKHARWRSADEACATIGAALGYVKWKDGVAKCRANCTLLGVIGSTHVGFSAYKT